MDGLKPGRGSYSHRPHARPSSHATQPRPHAHEKARHSGEKYWLVRSIGKLASTQRKTLWEKFKQTEFARWPDKNIRNRVYALAVLGLFIFSTAAAIIQPFIEDKFYGVTDAARGVLPEPKAHLGAFLKYDAKEATFLYNQDYKGNNSADNQLAKTGQGEPRISASFAKEARKGVSITDALNDTDFKLTPKFKLNAGKQDRNQIFYPLVGKSGYLVYTAQVASVKEDIVLEKATDDTLTFEYELGLGDQYEARLEKNGSIGIYGSSLPISGNVATGNEKDAELLKKARENAQKNKLLFVVPAPVVVGPGKEESTARSHFDLKGSTLKIITEGLKSAVYPLSIDPSVYVQSAAQLMRGNNESNVEFDVATEQFKKGTTTGARIDEWTQTGAMNDATYDQAVAAAGGYVYRAGGRSGQIIPYVADTQTTRTGTASTATALNMPAYRPAGFLYIAIIGFDGDVSITNTPSGWSNIVSNVNGTRAFYHVGGANEPATYTWNTSANQQSAAVIMRIANADTSVAPIGTSRFGSSGQVPTYNGITPTQNGSLIIGGASLQQSVPLTTGYAPTNNTEITSLHSTGVSGTGTAGLVASSLDAPPLANVSPGAQATRLPSASNAWGSVTIAIYGSTASGSYQSSVQWAQFNSTNGSIASPAPGSNGTACSNWCTDSAYNLPTGSGASDGAGAIGASMVAYNGYLYYVGGSDGTNIKDTVYIAKLGAKGEPSRWHPSDPAQANWVYWYKHTALSSARAYHSMYAYNGKMYILGGDTNLSSYNAGALDTVQIADILPNGTLGTWSSGQTLTGGARYGAAVQAYNGYLYVLGGNSNGTMLNLAQYSRLNSDGSMNSWQTANADGVSFTTARSSVGGVMSGIWGGYIYLAGGCAAVNTSGNGYCTSIASDVKLASINADGTLDTWNTMANVTHQRFGASFIAWQDNLYRFGGCSSQDAGAATCYATHIDNQYGAINQDGDASTVNISQAYSSTQSASNPCSGDNPSNCNLPDGGTGDGQGGQLLSSAVVLNGYLYVIGGCTTNACTTMTDNIVYSSIDSSGNLRSPPSCPGTMYGAWCVDNTNTISPGEGVGGASATVFGGNIYVVGGQNGSAATNRVSRNSVNADGSFTGAWQHQQMSGNSNLNAVAVSFTYAYARANPNDTTYPGNLYIFGGCTSPASGAGCNTGANYTENVYKCKITTSGALGTGSTNGCTTTGQQSIGTIPGASSPGLGIHAGTVYANYIYLIGGVADGATTADLKQVRYAKFDNNNNVVAVSGNAWIQSSVEMNKGRRRGTAFGYNGYLYAVGGYDSTSSSVLDSIEFAKINVTDGSLISPNSNNKFAESSVTINQRWGLALAVSNSYAYVIGGCKLGASPTCSSGGLDNTVQTFQVYNNDSGAPAGYVKESGTGLFTGDRLGISSAVMNGYIYMAGGCTGTTDCAGVSNEVHYAPIDVYGDVGAWSIASTTLPSNRAWGQLEVVGGTLYYVGGVDSAQTHRAEVYYTTAFSGAEPTTWGTASSNLPVALARFGATTWNNRLYIAGGETASGVSAAVYVSPQLNTGGNITSWNTTTSINIARRGATVISYANNLYVLGGRMSGAAGLYLSDVQFAKIDSSTGGISGNWTYTTSLPAPVYQADGYAVNGYMYLIGGRSADNDCQPRTILAPISANTSIASGNNPTGVGEWYQTNRNYDGGRYGAAVSYYNGKAYVLGGGCQGIVMQDNFDNAGPTYYDPTQWTSIANMQADYKCKSTSNTRTLSGTTAGTGPTGAIATTKSMDVSAGGTIYFKLYVPAADVTSADGTCYKGESPILGTGDTVRLEYCTGICATWNNVATYNWNAPLDPFNPIAVNIPNGGHTSSTKFRWYMTGSNTATDSFALEDVKVVAANSTILSYTGDKRVQYTTLLSQPQGASYSRLIDAGKDVFPTSWLMNGIDNSIGARWQYSYKSMNDPTATAPCGSGAMSAYGQLTTFGDVTLGVPSKYTVKDASGSDIQCGRYFFSTVSIDASLTYGYPDDISRGPTLDNFTLFFQSNPGQRLLHGKTFIEGAQQPLDTQCRQSNPLVSGNPSASGCLP